MSQTGFATLVGVGVAAMSLLPAIAEDSPALKSNRLAQESSPYLLLHAHNPVDWYPWGPEAFEKAKQEGKPIFLSIGYSSCYWCHVMERKVFSNGPIADYMNEHFVNIKVDREERPDVDDIYMTSLLVYQQLVGAKGGGGWPLSMFLTPEGNPIAGATYLPPDDSPERGPGFLTAATKIATLWNEKKPDLVRSGELIAAQVQRMTRPGVDLTKAELSEELVNAAVAQVTEMYDPIWGGVDFSESKPNGPRFPNVPRLELLLDAFELTGDKALLTMVEQSLLKMARGGIRDHLGGGFHRYSTDRKWHVPHFEKMLYDQALLLGVYARAAQLTGNDLLGDVAGEIADFVHREMTTAEGAFCSALDAETNAIEGEYYVWTVEQIEETLGRAEASVFVDAYGVNKPNSFEHGFVLHLPEPLADYAQRRNADLPGLKAKLRDQRGQLMKVRSMRERPLLDDKVLTSWNAMMIRALAYSGHALQRPQDLAAASRAAEFLLSNLRTPEGHLLRTWRSGKAKYNGYLDDYAFLVDALLELHRTTNEERWLEEAQAVAQIQVQLFYDDGLQAFYFTANDHEQLIARTSSVYDSVFPSANSVSIRNLIQLDQRAASPEFLEVATSTLKRFAPVLQKSPASCSGLARSLNLWLTSSRDGRSPEPKVSHVGVGGRAATDKPDDDGDMDTASPYKLTRFDDGAPPAPTSSQVQAQDPEDVLKDSEVIEQSTFRPVLPDDSKGAADKDDKEKLVKARIYPLYSKLQRGGKCIVAIELRIKDGWHINANPSKPDYQVPTKIELKTKQKVKLTKLTYPKHHTLRMKDTGELSHVYDGKVYVYGLLEIDEDETAADTELEFHVTFQGCNSNECLLPDKVIMKGKLKFADKDEPLKKINEDKFPKPKDKQGATSGKAKK